MKIESSTCDCCDAITYHLELDEDYVTLADGHVYLHADLEDLEDMYHSLREIVIYGEEETK